MSSFQQDSIILHKPFGTVLVKYPTSITTQRFLLSSGGKKSSVKFSFSLSKIDRLVIKIALDIKSLQSRDAVNSFGALSTPIIICGALIRCPLHINDLTVLLLSRISPSSGWLSA